MLHIGICGLRRSLSEIASRLDCLEIQETFYRPVSVSRAKHWREAARDDFLFTVKASQFITHEATSPTYRRSGLPDDLRAKGVFGSFRSSKEVDLGWEKTLEVVKILQAKAIVFQCPATFQPSPENTKNLYDFFSRISFDGLKALELRGGWPDHLVEKICEDLGLTHCVDIFKEEAVTTGIAYFRLHGSTPGKVMYRYSYAEGELKKVIEAALEFDEAFVLFNNISMYEDALKMKGLAQDQMAQSRGRYHS